MAEHPDKCPGCPRAMAVGPWAWWQREAIFVTTRVGGHVILCSLQGPEGRPLPMAPRINLLDNLLKVDQLGHVVYLSFRYFFISFINILSFQYTGLSYLMSDLSLVFIFL